MEVVDVYLHEPRRTEGRAKVQVELAAGERVGRPLDSVPLPLGDPNDRVLDTRTIGEHPLALDVGDVVVVEVDRQPLGRAETEIQRRSALEHERLAEHRVPRNLTGQLPQSYHALEGGGGEASLGAAPQQVVGASAHRRR